MPSNALFLILMLGSLFIASCSTISKEECSVGDWAGIGQRDSSKGSKQDRFYTYVKECGEHGVKPDHNAYKAGYSDGLKTYCTAENGWRVGKSGSSYAGICPKSLAEAFSRSYQKGKAVYTVNSKISQTDNEIRQIDDDIRSQQDQMLDKTKTGQDVAIMAMRVDQMRQKQRELEKRRNQLQSELIRLDGAAISTD